jgi:hypothetical protein
MKKTIITLAMGILFGGVFLTICGQSIRHTMKQLKPDHYLPPVPSYPAKDSSSEYGSFKQQALLKISENEHVLVVLHSEIACTDKLLKAKYFNLLLELRHENMRLKNRVLEYQELDLHNWMTFEHNFTEDIDQLTGVIRNFQLTREMLL